MEHSALVSILLMVFIVTINTRKIEVQCPEFCLCDVINNLKRAVCENRKLVSMQLNIPPQAEILDLSYNQISELGDKIFLEIKLNNLKQLNISHNKIRHIHFNGFIGLEGVKSLDLSFNALEYFTQSWFKSLSSLEELYLRGNKLRNINNEAPINISTLKVLDISKCGITSLKAVTLKLIPNLEVLDISENFIQVIQVELLKTLPRLTTLKTDDNNLNCRDLNVVEVGRYAKTKQISYVDSCKVDFPVSFTVNQKKHKFERIQMAENIEEKIEPTISMTPKNSWLIEDTSENNDSKIIEACSNATQKDPRETSLLMDILELSPWVTVTIIFLYGVLLGMVLMCVLQLCIKSKRNSSTTELDVPDGSINRNTRGTQSVPNLINRRINKSKVHRSNSVLYTTLQKAKRQLSREVLDEDHDEILVMNEFHVASSTPLVSRKPVLT